MSVNFSTLNVQPHGSRKKPQIEASHSEQRLQRLRYMYNAMLARDSTTTISKKGSLAKQPNVALDATGNHHRKTAPSVSRGNSSTASNVSNVSVATTLNEPASRILMARALGNVFSNQNSSVSRTTVRTNGSNTSQETETEKRIRLARTYGNKHSQLNVDKVKKQKMRNAKSSEKATVSEAHEDQIRWSNKTATHEYGVYYSLKNRLTLLEDQRDQMVRMYGMDAFLDEYTELLEECWRFEASHSNVSKYATGKIGRVLNDFERMRQKDGRCSTPSKVANKKKTKPIDMDTTKKPEVEGTVIKKKPKKLAATAVPPANSSIRKKKAIVSDDSAATLKYSNISDNDQVFTSQLTLQDLVPKNLLSQSVLKAPSAFSKTGKTTNDPSMLSAKTQSETVSVLETDVSNNNPALSCQRQESSTVYLDTTEEFPSTTIAQASDIRVDMHRASILSAIVEKNDGGAKPQDEDEDFQHTQLDGLIGSVSAIAEDADDTLDEDRSIELANEILRQIVTNCVESMMATTTRRHEIQSK